MPTELKDFVATKDLVSSADEGYEVIGRDTTTGELIRLPYFSASDTALRFTEAHYSHVNHGPFWISTGTYEECFWDFLVRPLTAGQLGYVISAGHGGNHNLLIGFDTTSGLAKVTGNMYIDGVLTSFTTDAVIPLGDWVHVAVSWDLANIVVWINGVAENFVAASGTERDATAITDHILYVGGSDHNNIDIDLAWVRGFEGLIPFDVSFRPMFRTMKFPRAAYFEAGASKNASFLADYTKQANIIADLSDGLGGVKHPGAFGKVTDLGSFWDPTGGQSASINNPAELPQWVPASISKPVRTDAVTIPGTAIVYDSFSNREAAPFWNPDTAFGLGSTEGGTAGIKAWSGGGDYVISYGRAFNKQLNGAIAHVDTGTANQSVRITRNKHVMLYARYTDANNYYFVEFGATGGATLSKRVAGADTQIWQDVFLAYSSDVRLEVNGTNIKVFSGGVQATSQTDSDLATGNRAGFKIDGVQVANVSLFEVYAP